MSIVVMGTNYKFADVASREIARISAQEAPAVLQSLCEEDGVMEAAVLSTCNRTELYLRTATDRIGIDAATSFFACRFGANYEQSFFYTYRNEAAARWLMRVASSLDSQVLGEGQILGQTKDALEIAQSAGTCKEVLGKLFKDAIHTGKRARTETAIDTENVSISTVAMNALGKGIDSWAEASVLLVGSGEIARLAARYIAPKGVRNLTVTSRNFEHACSFANEFDAHAADFADLHGLAAAADAVFVAVSASEPVLLASELERCRAEAGNRKPLTIVDAGMPRNVEKECGSLDSVTLFDLDSLSEGISAGLRSRRACIAQVEAIVEQGLQEYLSWLQARMVQPTIKEMHARCNDMVLPEISRAAKALTKAQGAEVSAEELKVLQLLANSVVKKILHGPTARLRSEAQSGDSSYLTTSARYLFGLDTHPLLEGEKGGERWTR